jgi:hypothetical protein
MNADPAVVESTSLSLKLRRNCTAGEASEPKVAVAMTHFGGTQGPIDVVADVTVVAGVVTVWVVAGVVTVAVVWIVVDGVAVVVAVVVVVGVVAVVVVVTPVTVNVAEAAFPVLPTARIA